MELRLGQRFFGEFTDGELVFVVLGVVVDDSRGGERLHIEILEPFGVTSGVDPGIVNWDVIGFSLQIKLPQEFLTIFLGLRFP